MLDDSFRDLEILCKNVGFLEFDTWASCTHKRGTGRDRVKEGDVKMDEEVVELYNCWP